LGGPSLSLARMIVREIIRDMSFLDGTRQYKDLNEPNVWLHNFYKALLLFCPGNRISPGPRLITGATDQGITLNRSKSSFTRRLLRGEE